MNVRRGHIKATSTTAAVCCLALLTSCTTLPGKSSPEAVSTYSTTPAMAEVVQPTRGNPSDLMLRDFFTASTHPLADHEAARKFLTSAADSNWEANGEVFVLDKMEIASDGQASEDRITYKVRGNLIGSVGSGGAYTPLFTGYETNYDMVRVDGEWRVDALPNAVIVDRSDFTAAYQPRNIYFLDQQKSVLAPDRRWIYTHQQSTAASLVSLLITGPRPSLHAGVHSMISANATAQTRDLDGHGVSVDFTGLTSLSVAERELLAAQVVWTLAAAEVRGPYTLKADGEPLSESVGETYDVDDVSRFDPRAVAATPLRALINGDLVNVTDDGGTEPLPGWLNTQYNESASYTPQGNVFALVVGRGEQQRELLVGEAGNQPQTALKADSITRPAWGASSQFLYVVTDGRQVVRLDRRDAGAVQRTDVNMDEVTQLEDAGSRISVFRVSRDGVRAVLLINGRVYVSVLENDNNGAPKLGPLVQVGHQIGDTAISADWTSEGSLLVGTRAADTPLWTVAVDGSSTAQMPARNLSAPVVAVAANADQMYATDARALMQLDNSTSDVSFWREVPPVRGQRAAPVLGY